MSKHVWLTKPTAAKADRLLELFYFARKQGLTPNLARTFATYALEAETQTGRSKPSFVGGRFHVRNTADERLKGAIRSGHQYAKGKNAANYTRCFENHVPLMLDQDYRIAGLSPETPPLILADWLEEHGDMEKANYVRSLVQD